MASTIYITTTPIIDSLFELFSINRIILFQSYIIILSPTHIYIAIASFSL